MSSTMSNVDELPVLARNVLRFRRARRLTQIQLAERCNLSRRTISNIERGEDPSVGTIQVLARALETTPAKLLDDPERHTTTTRYMARLRGWIESASACTREQLAELVRILTKGRRAAT
jgi:transcriptional regulator with XRE-family HTH domain